MEGFRLQLLTVVTATLLVFTLEVVGDKMSNNLSPCCRTYNPELSRKFFCRIKSYTPTSMCGNNRRAVLFYTKDSRHFCANPGMDWVRKLQEFIDSKPKCKSRSKKPEPGKRVGSPPDWGLRPTETATRTVHKANPSTVGPNMAVHSTKPSTTDLPNMAVHSTDPSTTDLPNMAVHSTDPSTTDLPNMAVHSTDPSTIDLPNMAVQSTDPSTTDLPNMSVHSTDPSTTDLPNMAVHSTKPSTTDLPNMAVHSTDPSTTDLPNMAVHSTNPSTNDFPNMAFNSINPSTTAFPNMHSPGDLSTAALFIMAIHSANDTHATVLPNMAGHSTNDPSTTALPKMAVHTTDGPPSMTQKEKESPGLVPKAGSRNPNLTVDGAQEMGESNPRVEGEKPPKGISQEQLKEFQKNGEQVAMGKLGNVMIAAVVTIGGLAVVLWVYSHYRRKGLSQEVAVSENEFVMESFPLVDVHSRSSQ